MKKKKLTKSRHKIYQTGGTDSILGAADIGISTDPERQVIYSNVDQMLSDYLQSPTYLNRLTNQGYTDPKNTQQLRLDALKNITVQETEGLGGVTDMLNAMPSECKDEYGDKITTGECGEKWATWRANVLRSGSMTAPGSGHVLMDANQIIGMNDQFGPIYAHEVGHNIGGSFPNRPVGQRSQSYTDKTVTNKALNYNDAYLLNTLNKKWQDAPWESTRGMTTLGGLQYNQIMGTSLKDKEGNFYASRVPGTLGYRDAESRGYYYPVTRNVLYPTLRNNLFGDDGALIEVDPDNNVYAPNPNFTNYSSDNINLEDVASQMTAWQQALAYSREMRDLHGRDSKEFKDANEKAENLQKAFMESDAVSKGYPTGDQMTIGVQKVGPIHDIGASESYADLTGLRFFAHQNLTNSDGSAWTPDQDLTPELWKQLVTKYKQDKKNGIRNLTFERMMERYGEDGENIINIHNTIAMENEIIDDGSGATYRSAKKGGLRKKYQKGGQSIEEEKKADYQGAINWFNNYLNSGQYKELLKRTSDIAGYPNEMYGYRHPSWPEIDYSKSLLDAAFQPGAFTLAADYEQKKFMENPAENIFYRYTGDVGSHYNRDTGKIAMGIPHKEVSYIPGVNMTHDSILAHELGHTDRNWITADNDVQNYILSKNKLVQEGRIGYYDPRQPDAYHHDAAANETRADLIQLRYELEKAGIFKSTGKKFKEFKKKHLKKAKDADGVHQRLFKIYSDEDIINLMNNIAQVDPNNMSNDINFNTTLAKKGGVRKKLKKARRKLY